MTIQTMDSCRIIFAVLHVHSRTEMFSITKFHCERCKVALCLPLCFRI